MTFNKFAMISTWPGAVCAEREVFERLKIAAKEIGKECYIITSDGYLLDDNQQLTKEKVNPKELDFIITGHFRDSKMLDCFYYHPLWNPPGFLLNDTNYTLLVNNYIQNDDFLIYGEGCMLNHLKSILTNSPRKLEGASLFVPAFPESVIKKPSQTRNKIFYCGINWEVLSKSKSGRHEGLLKKLDKTGCINIYGPNKVAAWHNKRPWKGYKSYKGEIPFDGVTMLNRINECGIALCLSSDAHRRTGASSSRIYEAIAGGAVIISDDNPFVKKHFSDAALFIDYNKDDVEDTYNQLMDKYNWVVSHPEEAEKLILRAQEIFRQKFSMNTTLTGIYNNHENRKKAVKEMLYATNDTETISILYLLNDINFETATESKISKVIYNLKNQEYKNLKLFIYCDNNVCEKVNEFVKSQSDINISVVPVEMYNNKGSKLLYSGQIFYKFFDLIDTEFYMFINENENWFSDHVTTLKRILEDNSQSNIAYSGCVIRENYGNTEYSTVKFGAFSNDDIYLFNTVHGVGQLMFRKSDVKLNDFIFDSLDNGYEVHYLMFLEAFRLCSKIIFSNRNSFEINKMDAADKKTENYVYMRYIRDLFKYELINKITGDNKHDTKSVQTRILKVCRASVNAEKYFYELCRIFLLPFANKWQKNEVLLRKINEEYDVLKEIN